MTLDELVVAAHKDPAAKNNALYQECIQRLREIVLAQDTVRQECFNLLTLVETMREYSTTSGDHHMMAAAVLQTQAAEIDKLRRLVHDLSQSGEPGNGEWM